MGRVRACWHSGVRASRFRRAVGVVPSADPPRTGGVRACWHSGVSGSRCRRAVAAGPSAFASRGGVPECGSAPLGVCEGASAPGSACVAWRACDECVLECARPPQSYSRVWNRPAAGFASAVPPHRVRVRVHLHARARAPRHRRGVSAFPSAFALRGRVPECGSAPLGVCEGAPALGSALARGALSRSCSRPAAVLPSAFAPRGRVREYGCVPLDCAGAHRHSAARGHVARLREAGLTSPLSSADRSCAMGVRSGD